MIKQVEQIESKPTAQGSTLKIAPVGRILVVDDEPELKNVLVAALSAQGFEATGCNSAQQALAELQQGDFDLLLTDLMMPEMDGIALLAEALRVDPNLVGIMMTGQGTVQTAVDAMKLGAFDYVLKPFRLQTLMPVLTRAINTRRLRMENLQLRETVAIYGLCQTIAFTLDPQTVLSRLADAALQQSDADEVSILLPIGDGKELYVAAVRGDKRERLLGERVPLHESISSWVARERTPVILNGEVHDERFVARWPRPEIRSAVSIPMQVANKLVGVINLNVTSRLRPFALGQMKALTILASTAAAALESASLHTQVERAEKDYRSIFENAVEGIFQSTLTGRFITVNPSLAHILGYASPREVIAHFSESGQQQLYVDPAFPSRVSKVLQECGVIKALEFEAYRKGGEKIWLSLNVRVIHNDQGRQVCREGTIEDITERKRSEDERLVIFEIIQGVITTRNLDELLRLIHKSIGKLLYAENCFVGLFNSLTNLISFEYWSDQFDPVPLPHPPGKGFSSNVLRTNRPLLLTEELRTQMFASGEAEPKGRSSASWLGVPLRIGSRAIGVLVVQHYEDKNAYSRRDLEFLSSVGDQIALAIERKLAENELKESEERYRDVVENAQDLIYEHDLEGNFTAINKAVERITGYSFEESLNLNLSDTVAPDYLEKAQEMLRRNLAGEAITAYDLVVIAKDGRCVTLEVTTSLVLKDGVPVGVQGIARDITLRQQVEEALRESEARKRAILESSMDCIITMDHEGLVVDWNPAAEKTFGYSQQEVIGRNMADLIIPQGFREGHRQGLARYLATGKGQAIGKRLELSAIRRDGTEFPIELTITRIESVAPMFTGYLRDITERKRSESQLSAQYAVTRALAESNNIGDGAKRILQALCESLGWEYGFLWTVDRTSSVLRCSQVWHSSGSKADEFESISRESVFPRGIGLPGQVWNSSQPVWIADLVEDQDFPRSSTAFKIGLYCTCAFPIGFRSEVVGVVEFFSRSIREPDPDLLAMMVTVGSQMGQFIERKRVEEALGDSEEQLRQSQKLEAIGQLAGGVAHDFNNLLTVIGGYSSILLGKLVKDSPHRTAIEEIKKASDRASALTRQLLAFSRKQILQPKVLDLNVVVTDLERMVRRLIGEDIDLLTITSPTLGKVKADPGQIEQVLLNLIVNARDAMPHGGKLTIETVNVLLSEEYAHQHAALAGPHVMLAVSDTGCGMNAALQARIFEPFFTTKGPGRGTGLGLATAYGIVKQSGGNVCVYSEVGRGSTFKIYLPQVVTVDEEEALASREVPRGTELVLLVEDEDQVRGIIQQILEGQGYHVIAASNGEEALSISQDLTRDIKLMITDVVMPQMCGRELTERISAHRPGLPVLFMSGYTDDAIVRHGLLAEKLNFLQKPFDFATVGRKVREVLDSDL